jgi:hypothetical protein
MQAGGCGGPQSQTALVQPCSLKLAPSAFSSSWLKLALAEA